MNSQLMKLKFSKYRIRMKLKINKSILVSYLLKGNNKIKKIMLDQNSHKLSLNNSLRIFVAKSVIHLQFQHCIKQPEMDFLLKIFMIDVIVKDQPWQSLDAGKPNKSVEDSQTSHGNPLDQENWFQDKAKALFLHSGKANLLNFNV